MINIEFLYAAGTSGQYWGAATDCRCSLKSFIDSGGTWRGGSYIEAEDAWRAAGNP